MLQNAHFLFLRECEANLAKVVFPWEASEVSYFVMVGTKLGGVGPDNSADEVALARVLLEGVGHRFLQRRHKRRSDLVRVALARLDDFFYVDIGADVSVVAS